MQDSQVWPSMLDGCVKSAYLICESSKAHAATEYRPTQLTELHLQGRARPQSRWAWHKHWGRTRLSRCSRAPRSTRSKCLEQRRSRRCVSVRWFKLLQEECRRLSLLRPVIGWMRKTDSSFLRKNEGLFGRRSAGRSASGLRRRRKSSRGRLWRCRSTSRQAVAAGRSGAS